MKYDFLTNSNLTEEKTSKYTLIPTGTLVKVRMKIINGTAEPGGFLTINKESKNEYIKAEFTVIKGTYADKRILQCIGVEGAEKSKNWINNGRIMLRRIIASSRGIHPIDKSDKACEARKLQSTDDYNGMEFVARIGVEHDKTGEYGPKNTILSVITPEFKEYQEIMDATSAFQNDDNVGGFF